MADLTYGVNFLNVTFGDDDLTNDSAIRDQPFLQKVEILQKGGSTVEEKFYLSGPRGFSGNLTDAQAVASASNGGSTHFRWQHPFGEHVGSVQVEVADIIQSTPDQAAANRALEAETEKGLAQEGQNINDKLMGSDGLYAGYGEYEETASGSYTSFNIRFADPSDARNFQIGDQVVISETDATTDGDLVGETGYVLDRDVGVGFIQVAALDDIDTAANPGSWVDDTNYYVFKLGEYGDGDPDSLFTAFSRYLPSARATSTLHNVDRSVDAALSGGRLPAAQEVGSTLQRAMRLLTIMQSRLGLKKSDAKDILVVLNSEDWGTGNEEMISKLGREVGEETEEGYEAFYCRTAIGKTAFVSEPARTKGRGFILNTALTKLYTATGQLFQTIPDGSGNIIHLMPGRNTYEIRTIAKVATGIGAVYQHGTFATNNA